MNKREEEQRYQRKIEELHSQLERAAKDLSQIESQKQQAIQDRDNAKKQKESLETQISALKAEVESLNNQVSVKQAAQEKRLSSQGIRSNRIQKNIKVLKSKLSQLATQVQQKKALVRDLTFLEKKYATTLTAYKKLLADSEKAKAELVKARKQAKQVVELSAKILSRAKEREAEVQAAQNAVSKARKTLLFYAKRINQWNQSKGLKPIDIQL